MSRSEVSSMGIEGIPLKARFCYMVCEGNVLYTFNAGDHQVIFWRTQLQFIFDLLSKSALQDVQVKRLHLFERMDNFYEHVFI